MSNTNQIKPNQTKPNQTEPNQSRSLFLAKFYKKKKFSLRGLQEVRGEKKRGAIFITTSTMQRKKKFKCSTRGTQLSQVSAAPVQQWPTARARVAVGILLEPAGAKKKNTENRKQKGQIHRNTHEASNTQRKKMRYVAHAHTQGNTCWFTCGPHVVSQVCTRDPCAYFPIKHDTEK